MKLSLIFLFGTTTAMASDPLVITVPAEDTGRNPGLISPLLTEYRVTAAYGIVQGRRLGIDSDIDKAPGTPAFAVLSDGTKQLLKPAPSFKLKNTGCEEPLSGRDFSFPRGTSKPVGVVLVGESSQQVTTAWYSPDNKDRGKTPIGDVQILRPPNRCKVETDDTSWTKAEVERDNALLPMVTRAVFARKKNGPLQLIKTEAHCFDDGQSTGITAYLGTLALSDTTAQEYRAFFAVSSIDNYSAIHAFLLSEEAPEAGRPSIFLQGGC